MSIPLSMPAAGRGKLVFKVFFSFYFLKVFLGFNVRRPDTKYDPIIHEEYLIHDTPIPMPHHL